ncbi:MAG: hypothetical protein LBI81_02750 [Puniceicoccales bacterium]|jgi:hypothetical protein|nr:hypothetical protein [Puniceicoccales bacterium]
MMAINAPSNSEGKKETIAIVKIPIVEVNGEKNTKFIERSSVKIKKLNEIKAKINKALKGKTFAQLFTKSDLLKRETKKTQTIENTPPNKTFLEEQRQLKEEILQIFKRYDKESRQLVSKGKFEKFLDGIKNFFDKINQKFIAPLLNFVAAVLRLIRSNPILLFIVNVVLIPAAMFAAILIGGFLTLDVNVTMDAISALQNKAYFNLNKKSLEAFGNFPNAIVNLDKEEGHCGKFMGNTKQKILDFQKAHPNLTELASILKSTITLGILVVLGILFFHFALPVLILRIWDLGFEFLTNILLKIVLPKLGELAEKYPTAAKVIPFVISSALQIIIGGISGIWMMALINVGINFCLLLFKERKAFLALAKKMKIKIFGDPNEKLLSKIIEMEDLSHTATKAKSIESSSDLDLSDSRLATT